MINLHLRFLLTLIYYDILYVRIFSSSTITVFLVSRSSLLLQYRHYLFFVHFKFEENSIILILSIESCSFPLLLLIVIRLRLTLSSVAFFLFDLICIEADRILLRQWCPINSDPALYYYRLVMLDRNFLLQLLHFIIWWSSFFRDIVDRFLRISAEFFIIENYRFSTVFSVSFFRWLEWNLTSSHR